MKKKPYKPRHEIEAAEPRLLFSAGLEGVLAAQTLDEPQPAGETTVIEQTLNLPASVDGASVADESGLELIFIDSDTPEYQALLDDLLQYPDESTRYEVIVLDNTADGIEQITAALDKYTNLSAVHILSHGADGAIDLGGSQLDADTVAANAEEISSWSNAFSETADFLIYGCELAATSQGQMLVNSLATLTGTDVAASDDLTGNAALGGDWELEYSTGSIETTVAISSEAQNSWAGVLAFAVDTLADTNDANPGDTLAEDGSGNTSLRAAIEEANALGGAHTITLGAGDFDLSLGTIIISSDVTITGAGADLTVIDAQSLSRVFAITGGNVSISGVTLQNGGNGSYEGGGVHIANNAIVDMTDVLLTGHDGTSGGAIWNDGTLTLDRVTLDLNDASDGGALYNRGNATITDSTVSNNTTTSNAGGIWTSGAGNTLDLTNVTISGNSTVGNGGGLYNAKDATLTNVTVTNNTASTGAGIHETGGAATTNITNSIVAGNIDTNDADNPDITGSYSSGGNNLIGNAGSATGFTDGVNGDQVGSPGSQIDPLLGALADNGGPTLSHALLVGSTAIDGGTNTGAPATDQRGTARDDGSIDIGAFEYSIAEVSIYQPWTNLAVSTDRSTTISANYTVTAAPGSDRLLVVTMVTRFGFDQTIDVTSATFGGVQLHEIVEGSSNTTRNGVWMGYLLDSEIPDGENLLSVSFTSTVSDPTGTKLLAATYVGVDQTTPVNDSSANNTKADAPISFGSQIDYDAGDEVVYVASYGGNTNTNTTAPAGYSSIYTNEWSGLLMTTIGHLDDTSVAGSSPASTAVDFEGTDANHSLAVVALNAVANNDAPLASNLDAAESYTEDTPLNLTNIVVSDVDSANVTVTLTLSDIAAGSLNTATSGAVTSTFIGGVWTASGAIADVNTLLVGASFTPTLNYNGNFTIATSVDDGVATAITGTKVMTGSAVNDAPVLATVGTPTLTQINEGDTNNNGDSVASIIASAGGDRSPMWMHQRSKAWPSPGPTTATVPGSTPPTAGPTGSPLAR